MRWRILFVLVFAIIPFFFPQSMDAADPVDPEKVLAEKNPIENASSFPWLAGDESSSPRRGIEIFARGIFSLLVVCGLIVLTMYVIRLSMKGKGFADKDVIRVIAIKHLTPKTSLYIVEVEGARLLLGVGDAGVRLVKDLGEKTEFLKSLEEEANALNNPDTLNDPLGIDALAKEVEALKRDIKKGLSDEKA